MLSIIVIARDEEQVIRKCIDGIESIRLSAIATDIEVVFVDSDSSDSTADLMLQYSSTRERIRVVSCKGSINAAVARRCGFEFTSGDFLLFVDGDTEISVEFVVSALHYMATDNFVAVTGQLSDMMYSDDFSTVIEECEDRNSIDEKSLVTKFGGNVLIRRSAYTTTEGWNVNFTVNEDFDFAIRLSRIGRILALPIRIGVHHTRWSEIRKRSFADLSRGTQTFYGQLLREHMLSKHGIMCCLSVNKGHQVGLGYWCLFVCSILLFSIYGLAILFILLIIDFSWSFVKGRRVSETAVLRIVIPLHVLKGFLCPYTNSKEYIAEEISIINL